MGQKWLLRMEDGFRYPWTDALSKEPGFVPCDENGNPIGGAAGLKVPGQESVTHTNTDPFSLMKKNHLIRILKGMPNQLDNYFSNQGKPVPHLRDLHIATLRKTLREILEQPEEISVPSFGAGNKPNITEEAIG